MEIELIVTRRKLSFEEINELVQRTRNDELRLLTLKEIRDGFKIKDDQKIDLDWTWTADFLSIGRIAVLLRDPEKRFTPVDDSNPKFTAWGLFVGCAVNKQALDAQVDNIKSGGGK